MMKPYPLGRPMTAPTKIAQWLSVLWLKVFSKKCLDVDLAPGGDRCVEVTAYKKRNGVVVVTSVREFSTSNDKEAP